MIDLSEYDYVVFDCDGVIINSNRLKTDAFACALEEEPEEYVDEMIAYHKANGGVSRYKKFRYYFEEINPYKDIEKRIGQAISNFANIVHKGLMECNYIPGVLDFIKELNKKKITLFVVSGSDEEELIDVFSKREIISLFSSVYGSPSTKRENMNKVMNIVGKQSRGVLFGDSKSDMEAAEEFGLDFVFVRGVSEWKDGHRFSENKGYLTIDDFKIEIDEELSA
jgi:HAD superfamily hydrolase (TIGR01549 family)